MELTDELLRAISIEEALIGQGGSGMTHISDSELAKKCAEWISSLCKTGGRSWSLRVPVDFDHDPDVLIIELIRRFKSFTPSEPPRS